MWGVVLLFIAVANCNAELYQLQIKELPSTTDNRIIGGSATTIQKYPYMVQVLYTSQFLCGGSLLTTTHVLSAAHCFVSDLGILMNADRYTIRAGSTLLSSGGTIHQVSAIRVHQSYNNPIRDNDIAVLFLSSAVNLVSGVAQAAFIPNQGAVVPENSAVTAVGWGLTSTSASVASNVLNEVTVRKINQTICQARYARLELATGDPYPVTSNMICSGILDVGGKDACQGDSGGPLLYNGIVVGVTSWGVGCAEPQFPGVSARVASYTNWISATVNDTSTQNNGTGNTTNPSDGDSVIDIPLPNNGTGNATNPSDDGSVTDITLQNNGTGNATNPGSGGSVSSKIGALTLLTALLFLILSV